MREVEVVGAVASVPAHRAAEVMPEIVAHGAGDEVRDGLPVAWEFEVAGVVGDLLVVAHRGAVQLLEPGVAHCGGEVL